MLKIATRIALALAFCITPALITPALAQRTNAEQRAYQAGYQNGVNDRNQNKPLNLTTGNWKGQNLIAYRKGYENGYRNRENGQGTYNRDHADDRGRGRDRDRDRGDDRDRDREGGTQRTDAEQRAYQAGYQNGVNDRNRNKPLNLTTGNWKGQNLTAYQQGYRDGYRGRGRDEHQRHKGIRPY
jgi:ribosome modulation factor